jgi:hypothetical protein
MLWSATNNNARKRVAFVSKSAAENSTYPNKQQQQQQWHNHRFWFNPGRNDSGLGYWVKKYFFNQN